MWNTLKTEQKNLAPEEWKQIDEKDEIEEFIFEWTKNHFHQASKCTLGHNNWDEILTPDLEIINKLLNEVNIPNAFQKETQECSKAIKSEISIENRRKGWDVKIENFTR